MSKTLEAVGREINSSTDNIKTAIIEGELVFRIEDSGRKFRTDDPDEAMFLFDVFASGRKAGVDDLTQRLKKR
jgi:hypothetical protein